MIGVVCGNDRDFRDFLLFFIDSNDRYKFFKIVCIRDVEEVESTEGRRFLEVIRIGTGWNIDVYDRAKRLVK